MAITLSVLSLAQPPIPPPSPAAPLPGYNVNIHETSVSGLSSGAFFATQMHVSFSSIMKGAGIVAGGPYDCAGQMMYTSCMYSNSPPVATSISRTNTWSGSLIDSKVHLSNHKVYLFSGTSDPTVSQSVMNQLYKYYVTEGGFTPAANVVYKKDLNTGHTFPTDFDSPGNIACTSPSGSPWISNCNFDGAGAILKHIYGNLNPRNNGAPTGQLIEFNQSEFISNARQNGMDDTGWVYVPPSCANGQSCRLHVAFHGCQQHYENIGDKFLRNTGYTKWADTNNIIVLFPQTVADNTPHPTSASFSLPNPNGCWDWIGWYGNDFDVKNGKQMAAVKKMIDRVASGYIPIPAPTGLTATGTTDNSISLAWNAVTDAVGYNVYRNDTKANTGLLSGTTYTDSGLNPGTPYTHTVKAVTPSGDESAASNAVTTTTTGTAPPISAPTNLAVTSKNSTSVSLSWTAVPGVAGYNIYRSTGSGGPWSKDNTTLVTGTSYTDSELSPSTTYNWIVRSQNSSGAESGNSNQVTATTNPAATCYTASNYAHVQAGRAWVQWGTYVYANGSNQYMGLYNTFFTTTLKQTGADHYVIGTCP